MNRAAIFGMGAIGSSLARDWAAGTSWTLAAVCVHSTPSALVRAQLADDIPIVRRVEDMLAFALDGVVEAAGHEAIRAAGPQILRRGCNLFLLSAGVLADESTYRDFIAAAEEGEARIIIPTGALAGFDGIRALTRGGATEILYRSIKPARAWLGTHAESMHDLGALTGPAVIFRGSARDAARLFPKNANLAASVALAGIGFDRTLVELVADPAVQANTAMVEAHTPNCTLKVDMSGVAEALNPKSSAIVRSSVLAALDGFSSRLTFG